MQLVKANEPTAARRRMRFDIRNNDGITAANGMGGQQPQISINDAPFTNAGIGTLNLVGGGQYYAEIDADQLDAGVTIAGRFRDAGNTVAETPARDSLMVVNFDPWDIPASVDAALTSAHGGDDWTNTETLSGSISGFPNVAISDAISAFAATSFARNFVINGEDFTGWTQVILTIKADLSDPDEDSILTIKKSTAGTDDGIVIQNGQAIAASANGALTIAATTEQITVSAAVNAAGMNVRPSPTDAPYVWELTIYLADERTIVGTGEFAAVRPVRRSPAGIP